MGIEYKAAIVVGLHAGGFTNADVRESLEQFAPYYDGYDVGLFGVEVVSTGEFSAAELPHDLDTRIKQAKAKFEQLTGQDGEVWITPVSY